MKFYIPGKTFLVGEYSVLLGGAALGLATKPFFELSPNEGLNDEVHPESPAGRYLRHKNKNLKFSLRDHYFEGGILGGFGKSTAEYFAASLPELIEEKVDFFEIIKTYKKLHSNLHIPPSGIDLAFQYWGNVTLADSKINFYQSFDWPFVDLDFYIVSTGLKVPTHQHLSQLDLGELTQLPALSEAAIKSFVENNRKAFLVHMAEWVSALERHNLTHFKSLHLTKQLQKSEHIHLAKPCGALGADVLLVLFDSDRAEHVKKEIEKLNLNIRAGREQLVSGLLSQIRSL
jgi:mevalonate kinase